MDRVGDHARFNEVMLPHLNAVYTLARHLCRDPHEAEEIAQETFLRAFRSFDDWRGESPKAWLLKIARNYYFSSIAGAWRRSIMVELIDRDDIPQLTILDNPEDTVGRKLEVESAMKAIGTLPPVFREVIVLRELNELSYREIGSLLNVPIGTVMSRLARARQMLADRLLAGNVDTDNESGPDMPTPMPVRVSGCR